MNKWILLFSAFCVIMSALAAVIQSYRTEKIMEQMEKMLDDAMDGSFREKYFDETRLSRLEGKLAHYLAANEVSAKNLAEEKEKIKTLISDISHQTRTPISNLLLYSELLLEESLSEEAGESVILIRNQAEKLGFLITSLVKLSRLETGILQFSPKGNSLKDMLLHIQGQYGPAAKEKGLDFTVCGEDAWAVFDRKWTEEALLNLVDNAIKYTKTGSVCIMVKPYELFTCIEVKDTGKGIPEWEQAKIFGRFYRDAGTKEEKGVGIGLFLARQIISSQGGYIKVSSAPGKGSVFSVYLPALADRI